MLNQQQLEESVAKFANKEIADTLRLRGIDYYSLDENTRNIYIDLFHAGIQFVDRYKKNYIEEQISEIIKKEKEKK